MRAPDDEVDRVEQRLAADRDVERDVRLRFISVVVSLDVLAGGHVENVPLDAPVEVPPSTPAGTPRRARGTRRTLSSPGDFHREPR